MKLRIGFIGWLLLVLVLLFCLPMMVLAQDPLAFAPFMMQKQFPTETTPADLPDGYSAFVWYEPHLGYATNSGIATLSNLAPSGAIFNLTNGTAATMPIRVVGNLNGLDTLSFRNAQDITCNILTNWAPWEIFIVLAYTNAADGTIVGSAKTSPSSSEVWHFRGLASQNSFQMQHGAGGNPNVGTPIITNKYIVADCAYSSSGTDGAFYTNNILSVAVGLSGAGVAIGLRVGSRYDGGVDADMSVACIFAFTNQILSASARLAAYQYCTNRFGLAP